MDTKIKKFLEKSNLKHELIHHRTVYTAFTAAATQHVKATEVVKTVLVKLDKPISYLNDEIEKTNLVLVSVPAGKHLDFKKIQKFIKDTQTKFIKKNRKLKSLPRSVPQSGTATGVKVSIAKEKDIAAKLKTKYLLAPLPVYGIPVLMDKKLTSNKNVIFCAGSFTESIKTATSAYIKLVNPLLGAFSK